MLFESVLTSEQKRFWKDNGYLVLHGFFKPQQIDAVNAVVDRIIQNPRSLGQTTVDPLTGEHAGKRFRAAEAPPEAFQGPIKINDLFLDEPDVRSLALDKHLTKIVAKLLGGAPMICNSLNFIWGSTQPAHFDTWYMPPPVADKLAVSSICLEDVHPSAGPLFYYPGSHKIKPYRFSHGGIHAITSEMAACRTYVEQKLKEEKLEPKEFLGKAGDVFLWHGELLHGGSQITDMGCTRKTLVTHYWRAQDVKESRRVKVHDSGYYERREHQAAG